MTSSSYLLASTAMSVEVLSYSLYARDIRRGWARPSRASWLIWTPLSWLTLLGSWRAGGDTALLKLMAMCIGVSVIAALSLRHGTGGWSMTDRACLLLTAVGIAAWASTDDPVTGLLLFLVADITGAVPTARDVLREPDKDSRIAWMLTLVASGLNLAAIRPEFWLPSWQGFGLWGTPSTSCCSICWWSA